MKKLASILFLLFACKDTPRVEIVEAFDFACPYCAMSSTAIAELRSKHPNVNVVTKQFIVHPDTATIPALATCAAQNQGKGSAFEQAVWRSAWAVGQPKLHFDPGQLKPEALDTIAVSLALDLARFQHDRDGSDCKDKLAREQKDLAAMGVRGTPAFYINGKLYTGPRTVEGFEAAMKSM